MLNYEEIKNVFNHLIELYKTKIINDKYSKEELEKAIVIKNTLIINKKATNTTSLSKVIKIHRLEMLDTKINHTMRVVENATLIAKKLHLKTNLITLIKIVSLLHDFGRFEQATWSNTFVDSSYSEKGIAKVTNHADAGFNILFSKKLINKFPIDPKYYNVIAYTIKHHADATSDDIYPSLEYFKENDIDEFLKDSKPFIGLNQDEKALASLLVKIVKDADMLDIFNQYLTGEIPIVRDYINYYVKDKKIKDIAKEFGITEQEIIDFNGKNLTGTIKVPVINIPISKLNVNANLKKKFFNREYLDLKKYQMNKDWHFISSMWWRLGHFLNNINFVVTLNIINDIDLLDKIYKLYPDKYRILVVDAFQFSKNELINKRITNNKNKIYLENQTQKKDVN